MNAIAMLVAWSNIGRNLHPVCFWRPFQIVNCCVAGWVSRFCTKTEENWWLLKSTLFGLCKKCFWLMKQVDNLIFSDIYPCILPRHIAVLCKIMEWEKMIVCKQFYFILLVSICYQGLLLKYLGMNPVFWEIGPMFCIQCKVLPLGSRILISSPCFIWADKIA